MLHPRGPSESACLGATTPWSFPSRQIPTVNRGWDIPNRCAARSKCSSSVTAMNYSILRKSIIPRADESGWSEPSPSTPPEELRHWRRWPNLVHHYDLDRDNIRTPLQREGQNFEIVYSKLNLTGITAVLWGGFGIAALAARVIPPLLRSITNNPYLPKLSVAVVGISVCRDKNRFVIAKKFCCDFSRYVCYSKFRFSITVLDLQ